MKKILTLLLLFTLIGFLSGNQVIITNDYQYIVSTGKTYNFNNGNPSNNVKYDRTNKIQIQNNKVIANPLKYHYAFFWTEADTFIGYYKTNKGLTTSGAYLGQVNTQSIPLPLNAYSFALVRYDNDYVLVNGYTIEELFIDNNLAGVDPADFNDIPIAELNGLTLNEVFIDNQILQLNNFTSTVLAYVGATATVSNNILNFNPNGSRIDPRIAINNNPGITNNLYYTNIKYKPNVVNFVNLIFTGNFPTTIVSNTATLSQYKTESIITTMSTATQSLYRFDYANTTDALNGNIDIEFINLYNLTALGLTSLTKATLDTYFNIWQNGVNATYYATDGNVSTVDGYFYAAGKNLLDKSNIETDKFISNLVGTVANSTGNTAIIDFFQILPNTAYRISTQISTGLIRGAFYDKNNVYISGIFSNNQLNFQITSPSNAYYIRLSSENAKFPTLQLEEGTIATTFEAFATPTTTLNLTFLFGVGNEPNKATMDGYYAEYEDYLEYLYVCCNIFATQTISFETIYFDDGVSTEIQRLGSILIFTLIGFTLMIFGFVSRRRIFNLLSIGAFIVLGFLLVDFVGFIIILFGLVFINVYYTFFGEL